MTSLNPHYVPGMGFKKHQPVPKPPGTLDQVVARTSCADVELKITLSTKLLVRPLRNALVEPFLKAYNKRAMAEATWDDVACVKVDGVTLDGDLGEVTAQAVLPHEHVRVQVVLRESMPRSLFDGLLAVAREPPAPYSGEPPAFTQELVRVARVAASAEDFDADMSRRCENAFEQIGGGAQKITSAAARAALLRDEHVRELGFPQVSPHGPSIDGALRRMATDAAVESVDLAEFSALFAALSAAACAPPEAAIEDLPIDKYEGVERTGNSFLDELLNDDSCSVRRVA